MTVVYHGAVLARTAAGEVKVVEAMAVDGEHVVAVGSLADVIVDAPAADVVDVEGLVVPGFIDGHAHLHMHGESSLRADLSRARDVPEIVRLLEEWSSRNDSSPRVLGKGWYVHSLGGQAPTRQVLDVAFPDRPCYLDAADLHSVWVNTAALRELGIDDSTPDPIGGRIHRDASGRATGLLDETVVTTMVWPFLASQRSEDELDRHLRQAIADFHEVGVTSVVDMAVDERGWQSFERVAAAGGPPLQIGAHWLVDAAAPLDERMRTVDRAAGTATDPQQGLHTRGIKIISDGVIDGCTAALSVPYTTGDMPPPIWPVSEMVEVIGAAHNAGLAVAVHAIGDAAVTQTLDAYETVLGPRASGHRHRIEHLEYTDPDAARRCAEMGLVVSMQPIHADPYGLTNWVEVLGPERAARGFAWPEYTSAGAVLAFSTDTPTAPHSALGNLWVATTRRSVVDTAIAPLAEHYSLPVVDALLHATRDAAWACGLDRTHGTLAPGMAADFAVLDRNPLLEGPDALLEGRVLRTVAGGVVVHDEM